MEIGATSKIVLSISHKFIYLFLGPSDILAQNVSAFEHILNIVEIYKRDVDISSGRCFVRA
jgi:hypothetical protein